jgi:hypothetical protein
MGASVEKEFEQQLEFFRSEVEVCILYLSSYLTIRAISRESEAVQYTLLQAHFFWHAIRSALVTATFMTLGRIFDQDSPHNVYKVLKIAEQNTQIFSRQALKERKEARYKKLPDLITSWWPDDWLDRHLRRAHEPTAQDFRTLRAYLKQGRTTYEGRYRELRHKVFAHSGVGEGAEREKLFATADLRPLEHILAVLLALYHALWQLYHNGRKPMPRVRRYSVEQIRKSTPAADRGMGLAAEVVQQAEEFLRAAAGATEETG